MKNTKPDKHFGKQERANQSHYDQVTDAWRIIFGGNFHWGYFESEDTDFKQAGDALIDKLAELVSFTKKSDVLDIGCGIGGPALYLHKKFECQVTGISTSIKGVKIAADSCKARGYEEKVRFQFANALDNGFPDNAFDIVWMMESSHLMSDKKKVFEENFRVLKQGGVMLVCDNMVQRKLCEKELVRYYKELSVLQSVFGKMKHETLEFYMKTAQDAGFTDIQTIDIGPETYPSIHHFKRGVKNNSIRLRKDLSHSKYENFVRVWDILDIFYSENVATYGILKASKL
jgi:27-O-demethylrifamycin SV methyltransferase